MPDQSGPFEGLHNQSSPTPALKAASSLLFAPKRLSSYSQWTSKVFDTIRSGATDGDAFYVGNLARVSHQLTKWRSLLPMVEPHYGT